MQQVINAGWVFGWTGGSRALFQLAAPAGGRQTELAGRPSRQATPIRILRANAGSAGGDRQPSWPDENECWFHGRVEPLFSFFFGSVAQSGDPDTHPRPSSGLAAAVANSFPSRFVFQAELFSSHREYPNADLRRKLSKLAQFSDIRGVVTFCERL